MYAVFLISLISFEKVKGDLPIGRAMLSFLRMVFDME